MAVDIVIYHNPACGTSRNTLAMIRNAGIEPHVIEYLKTPPSRALLVQLIDRAGTPSALWEGFCPREDRRALGYLQLAGFAIPGSFAARSLLSRSRDSTGAACLNRLNSAPSSKPLMSNPIDKAMG